MSEWLISRDMNMTRANVMVNLIHPELWNQKKNPAATPSALADWGFVIGRDASPLGHALMDGELSWEEACILSLAKRGPAEGDASVKPFVAIMKALAVLQTIPGEDVKLTARGFTRLTMITTYEELTSDFCRGLNAPEKPNEAPLSNYRDIWLNALAETGLFIRVGDNYELIESTSVSRLVKEVATYGTHLSGCPSKKSSPSAYYKYMGAVDTGLTEIFGYFSADVIRNIFPHFLKRDSPKRLCEDLNTYQLIIYGPPGTGKSRGIEEMVKDCPDRVIRTTFHPDSDYSTFVGAYKPTMVDDPYETIVQVNKIVRDREGKDSVQSELKPVRQRHIAYLFVEQAFTKAYVKAWRAWAERPSGGVAESVYLIIEEINRGNCAQVFGDIFQLLDREDGFSQYPIQADEDLRQHLAKEFEGLDFGEKFERVRLGRELVLPSNLYIWATMNTSDQSLFPMDSAFKRRWNWQYVPIKDAAKNWQIVFSVEEGGKVERKTYSWWDFLCRINDVIERLTSSEDKQMGYFFVKPINGEIDEKLLVNKVFFYLWNDVFRDVSDVEELEVMIDGHTQNLKFHHFFNVLDGKEDEASINTHILRDFMDKLMGSTSPAVE